MNVRAFVPCSFLSLSCLLMACEQQSSHHGLTGDTTQALQPEGQSTEDNVKTSLPDTTEEAENSVLNEIAPTEMNDEQYALLIEKVYRQMDEKMGVERDSGQYKVLVLIALEAMRIEGQCKSLDEFLPLIWVLSDKAELVQRSGKDLTEKDLRRLMCQAQEEIAAGTSDGHARSASEIQEDMRQIFLDILPAKTIEQLKAAAREQAEAMQKINDLVTDKIELIETHSDRKIAKHARKELENFLYYIKKMKSSNPKDLVAPVSVVLEADVQMDSLMDLDATKLLENILLLLTINESGGSNPTAEEEEGLRRKTQ